jgi:hypothetical protein
VVALPRRASAVGASLFSAARARSGEVRCHTGWLNVMASPQYAIAKLGSAFCASTNASRASSYSNECINSTPLMKCG